MTVASSSRKRIRSSLGILLAVSAVLAPTPARGELAKVISLASGDFKQCVKVKDGIPRVTRRAGLLAQEYRTVLEKRDVHLEKDRVYFLNSKLVAKNLDSAKQATLVKTQIRVINPNKNNAMSAAAGQNIARNNMKLQNMMLYRARATGPHTLQLRVIVKTQPCSGCKPFYDACTGGPGIKGVEILGAHRTYLRIEEVHSGSRSGYTPGSGDGVVRHANGNDTQIINFTGGAGAMQINSGPNGLKTAMMLQLTKCYDPDYCGANHRLSSAARVKIKFQAKRPGGGWKTLKERPIKIHHTTHHKMVYFRVTWGRIKKVLNNPVNMNLAFRAVVTVTSLDPVEIDLWSDSAGGSHKHDLVLMPRR